MLVLAPQTESAGRRIRKNSPPLLTHHLAVITGPSILSSMGRCHDSTQSDKSCENIYIVSKELLSPLASDSADAMLVEE